jgi:hypothetical protein
MRRDRPRSLLLTLALVPLGVALAPLDVRAQQGTAPVDAVPTPPESTEGGAPPDTGTGAPPDAAQGAQGGDASGVAAVPEGPRRRLIVIDVATYGIDPVVGRVATDRIRRTGGELGYEVLDAATTVASAQRLRMAYPPTPADLWRVTWVAQAHRGAFARIWAAEGRYVIEVMVASLDGSGPFFGRETAAAADLREVIDRLVRQSLPPPSQWQETQQVASIGQQAPPPGRARPREELAHPGGIGVRLPDPPIRRFQVTLQTEAVIGTTQGGFYNHMVGARFDIRITRDLLIGAYLAYTNLQGRNDRAHNLLVMLQGEQRIRVSPALDLTIPIRVGLGYLPFNGPVIRVAAGINYPISPDFEIGADLIAPTFWILPDDVAISLDIGLEATYRLP